MTKIRNQRIYSDDPEFLKGLAADLEWMGREYRLDLREGLLTVFALPQKRKKKKGEKDKKDRNKRAEKHARS